MQNDYPETPTIYALLNSKVNYGKTDEEKTPISGLAAAGRSMFFDNTYPLANVITREYFETTILNHFLMRRIGFDTVTAFKIQLNTKLCEIMPEYNKLFTALEGWNLFNDGESVTRNTQNANSNTSTGSSTAYQTTTATGSSTNKYSDTPQNDLSNVDDGNYVTEYTKNNNSSSGSTSTATNNNDSNSGTSVTNETITRTPSDKIRIYEEFISNRNHIFSMIFKELDPLFYQLI